MNNQLTLRGFLLGSLFFATFFGACQMESKTQKSLKELPTATLASAKVVVDAPKIVEKKKEDIELLTIIGVGDMMLGTNYPSASYLPPQGGETMLADMKEILLDADVTFGNLEGAIFDEGGTAKRCSNPNVCYVFRSPEAYIKHYTDTGFDVLSIANNHSGDFGPVGRKKTKAVLDKAGIAYAGLAGTDEMTSFTRNGVKYGFAAFAPNVGTCDIRNITKAKQIVAKLEAENDVVIVSFHGGAEGAKHQNVPKKTETYYGENRGNVYAFAHAVVDAGADIVFGHGPHVTRSLDLYKNRFITYSLGNFCTYGRFNLRGPAGIAPLIKVTTDKHGGFVHAQVTPVYQTKTQGPKVDPQKRAIKKLQELTAQDFPDSGLNILDDGLILKK